jgi:hypothetical protein
MSDEGSCPNGNPDCEFGLAHELALAEKIMRMIGGYSQDGHIAPCPRCLRDTMLAVAALLHLEAARLDAAKSGQLPITHERFDEAFAKAARERLQAIIQADSARLAGQKH